MPGTRVTRPTLTYNQIYGPGSTKSGIMEGKGIFNKIGNFLKKSKILSTVGSIAAPFVSILPIPGAPAAAAAVGAASAAAKQAGLGKFPKSIKSITPQQMQALKEGRGKLLKKGGVNLQGAKDIFPGIKNLSPLQMRAIRAFRGRHMKGGGVSLAGGKKTQMTGLGYSGEGVKLVGTGKRGRKKKRPAKNVLFV